MNPIVILAELLAHGMTVERRAGIFYYVGVERTALPPTLLDELNEQHGELEAYLNMREGSHHAV